MSHAAVRSKDVDCSSSDSDAEEVGLQATVAGGTRPHRESPVSCAPSPCLCLCMVPLVSHVTRSVQHYSIRYGRSQPPLMQQEGSERLEYPLEIHEAKRTMMLSILVF